MARTGDFILGSAALLVFALGLGAWMFISLKKSEDPARLIVKWSVTLLIVLVGVYMVFTFPKPYAPAIAALFGLLLAIVWTLSIINTVSKPLISLFNGGDDEPEPTPMYSVAESKRRKGLFDEAVCEIRKQLEAFPNDTTGTMMLASILAEDLKDLPGAEDVIDQFLARPDCPPNFVSGALQTLADWKLRYAMDPEGARAALQRIIDLLPDSQWSQIASQRIARLPTAEHLRGRREPGVIKMVAGRQNIGLEVDAKSEEVEVDPAALANGYVKQLQAHPLDADTREKLAMLYAEYFKRPDMAADQIEQLISQPGESSKRVVRWLNLLATIQLQHGNDLPAAEQTLRRIMELFPGAAPAQLAMARLGTLKSELKRNESNSVKHLGSYEHDVGLKQEQAK